MFSGNKNNLEAYPQQETNKADLLIKFKTSKVDTIFFETDLDLNLNLQRKTILRQRTSNVLYKS